MVSYKAYSKKAAEDKAKIMRSKGYQSSVYNLKGKGYGISVTRNMKKKK